MDIQNIKTHDLTPGDIIVLTIDIGKMPPQRAKEYMLKHKEAIQEVIGTDYKIIVKSPLTQIEIIRTPINVPTKDALYAVGHSPNDLLKDVVTEEPVDTDGMRMDDFERAKPIE